MIYLWCVNTVCLCILVCMLCAVMCLPTFESSGPSYSAVQGLVCSDRPRHNRSRRAAGQTKKLLLFK